ncbi:MAG: putative MscS family protein YkuT [Firmicutes bacterium ADurb.Bin182]|nr:MAG: putative MscS family protein YkuT [Firmicutes bacterium ADurb.Bin182]
MLSGVRNALEEKGLGFIISIVYIVFVFALAKVLSTVLNRAVKSLIAHRSKAMADDRRGRLETAGTLIASISKYILFFIAFAVSLGELGLGNAMNSMLAAAGIGGIAIGIGAQNLIKDIATGFFILFEDQFSVGDYVAIGDITGTVERIELRTTSVRGYRGELSIIPNGSIGAMTNYSRSDYLAIVDMPVEHGADIQKSMDLMRDEALLYAKDSQSAHGEASVLGIVDVREDSAVLRMILTVRHAEHWQVQRELTKRIKERFEKEGIGLSKHHIRISGD